MSRNSQEVVWVPDEHNILRPAADLTFDDASWLDSPEMDYAHKTLSKEVGHTPAGNQLPPTWNPAWLGGKEQSCVSPSALHLLRPTRSRYQAGHPIQMSMSLLTSPLTDLQVCSRVGVYALRERLLEESSDMMEFSEEYGQSEAITTRLKHITGALTGLLLKVQPAEQSDLLACPCCVKSDHIKSASAGVETWGTCLHQMPLICGIHAL